MIFKSGKLMPTAEQVHHARRLADESFCVVANRDFMANFPIVDGWEVGTETPILIRLRNCEPHSDPWVGRFNSKPTLGWDAVQQEPIERRAVFWVIDTGPKSRFGTNMFFGCGADTIRLTAGDYVVFDDRITHWVMSDRVWRGAAIQLLTREAAQHYKAPQ